MSTAERFLPGDALLSASQGQPDYSLLQTEKFRCVCLLLRWQRASTDYLSDVLQNTAPFEYLRKKTTHEPVRVKGGMPPKYPKSRVPNDVIENYIANGYEAHKVLGPTGTMLLFDEKIIHRGNMGVNGHRDVVILQLKPVAFKPEKYIDPRWSLTTDYE